MKNRLLLFFIIVVIIGLAGAVSLFFIKSNYSSNVKNVPQESSQKTVKIFFIALEDNGASGKKIGCNDTAVAVDRIVDGSKATMQGAVEELLSVKDHYYGESGLYNSLSEAALRVDNVVVENGKATIKLSGTYTFTGVCEDARFMSQIEETALQFVTANEVEIFLNGRSLNNMYKGE